MKKFKKKEIIALAVIAVLIIAVIIAGIVIITGNVNEANNKLNNTTATSETQSETRIVTDEEGNTHIVGVKTHKPEAEDDTEKADNEEGNSQTNTTATNNNANNDSGNSNNSDNSSNSDNSNTNNSTTKPNKKPSKNENNVEIEDTDFDNNLSGNTGEIDVIVPETKPVEKEEEVLTINDTKCNVGNTITITVNVKTPTVLENYQGFTEFDNNYLEFVSVKGNVSGIFNEHESVIYYNGSDIGAGYDFTNNGTLYTATFKVLKAGSTKINNVIEVMSDKNSNPVDQTKCEYSVGIFNQKLN